MQGSASKISLQKNNLVITFPYDPKKVAELKKLRGARFIKEKKHWVVPIGSYFLLRKSRVFARSGEFNYDFTERELLEKKNKGKKQKEEARARILENPFSVRQEDIDAASPDFVIYQNENILYLKSKKKIFDNFVKKENAYYLETSGLAELLKTLRDSKKLFAVERETGERLKRTAELRAKILKAELTASEEELEDCLLTPYINSDLSLKCFTNEHLATLFKDLETYKERKAASKNLCEDRLLRVLGEATLSNLKVYKTAKVEELLEKKRPGLKKYFVKNPKNFPIEILACVRPDQFLHAADSELLHYKKESGTYSISKKLKKDLPTTERYEEELKRREEQNKVLEKRNYYQNLTDCSPELIDQDLEKKLYPHQRVSVKWLKENKLAYLGDDMGLGKTLSVLATFLDLKKREEVDFLLVVCPNSLTRNWQNEARSWTPGLVSHALPSGKEKRIRELDKLARLSENFDILVLNFEVVRLDYVLEKLLSILESRKSMLVVDESQRAKNAQSKTFAALNLLAEKTERRVLLSGTPIPKDISDIWSQVYLLDRGARFGTSYYKWLEKIAVLGNKYSEYAIKSFRTDEVKKVIPRVQEILLRRKKEDVIDLPEKIFSERYIELSGEQKKRYEEVRKELLLRVSAVDGNTYTKEISSILEEYLRAVQIASNPRLIDENFEGTPAKFAELDEIVNEVVREGEKKLVIWTSYIKNTEELATRYKDLGARIFNGNVSTEERAKTIKEFQEGEEIKVLMAIPAAGGVGITLTAAQTAVYLDKSWNAEHFLQSVDRIHRIGQKGSVQIISLNSTPVDYLIQNNLKKKEEMQKKLLGDVVDKQIQLLPTREELLKAVS